MLIVIDRRRVRSVGPVLLVLHNNLPSHLSTFRQPCSHINIALVAAARNNLAPELGDNIYVSMFQLAITDPLSLSLDVWLIQRWRESDGCGVLWPGVTMEPSNFHPVSRRGLVSSCQLRDISRVHEAEIITNENCFYEGIILFVTRTNIKWTNNEWMSVSQVVYLAALVLSVSISHLFSVPWLGSQLSLISGLIPGLALPPLNWNLSQNKCYILSKFGEFRGPGASVKL